VNWVKQPARDIPVVAETDVLVVGGGTAGLPAAAAAGRAGAEVLLLERYGYVGGAASGGLVITLPKDRQGVFTREIEQRLCELKAASRPPEAWFGSAWCPEMLKWLGLKMLEEAKVRMLFHSWAVDALVEDNVVKGVVIESKAGRQAVLANVVVDCTGDADIAAFAGAPFVVGDGLGNMIGVTMMFMLLGVDETTYGAEPRSPKPRRMGRVLTQIHPGELNIWGGREQGIDGLNPWDLTKAENELRKQVVEWVEWAKRDLPGCEGAHLALTSPQLGVRETRRIVGQYTLSEEDWEKKTIFDDHIGFAYIDKSIPYRSLVPKEIDNLLVAGRCVSFERAIQEEMRLIPPCMVTGYAAGMAAAQAVNDGVPPRDLNTAELQQSLKRSGVNFPQ